MAKKRDRLYSRFRFLIAIGDPGQSPHGGFDEVSGLGTDVTLKSGVIDGLEFRRWLDDSGIGGSGAARSMTISQRDERQATVATWKLTGARIVKRTTGRLNTSDAHVAIEELGLACDGVELVEA